MINPDFVDPQLEKMREPTFILSLFVFIQVFGGTPGAFVVAATVLR